MLPLLDYIPAALLAGYLSAFGGSSRSIGGGADIVHPHIDRLQAALFHSHILCHDLHMKLSVPRPVEFHEYQSLGKEMMPCFM